MTIVNVLLRKDLQELAKLRLREAEVLQTAGLFDGALYLGGFAVECALKACIARGMAAFRFPDAKFANLVNTHQLDALVREAGLDRELESASAEIWETGGSCGIGASNGDMRRASRKPSATTF